MSNNVHSLAQDSQGNLWIGTNEGVSRFDAVSFTNFTTRDGLSCNYVNSILEPRESPGVLWFGTNGGGISVYSQGTFTTLKVGNSPATQNVNILCQDVAGTIWAGTDDGVFRTRGGTPEPVEGHGTHGPVASIAETAGGTLIFGFPSWLGVFDPATNRVSTLTIALAPGVRIDRIWSDREKRVWMATSDGALSTLDGARVITHARLNLRYVYAAAQDERGHMILATARGLFELERSGPSNFRVLHYDEANGLPERFVSSILLDREGNLWTGMIDGGIAQLGERDIALFPLRDPTGFLSQPAAAADTNGHIWATSSTGVEEFFRREDGGWSIVDHPEVRDPASRRMLGLSLDREGKLWVTYIDGGLDRFDIFSTADHASRLKRSVTVPPPFSKVSSPPAPVLVDRSRRLWYCCDPAHALVLDMNNGMNVLKRFGPADSLPGGHIARVCEDSSGDVWIGGFSDGLARVSRSAGLEGRVQRFREADGLPDNAIRALCTANDGRVWIGTRFGGLASFSGGTFTTYGTGRGLLSDAVTTLAPADSGKLWVGTSRGLQPFDPAGPILFGNVVDLTGEMVGTCGVSRGGMLWCTTHQGLFVYHTPHNPPGYSPPTAHISRLSVNGLTCPLTGDLTFSSTQNNCVLEYVGVSLRHGPLVRYQYRLSGLDDEWSPPTAARTVTYAALPPGPYGFEVRSVLRGNPSTGTPAVLTFTITPPIWMRWWFLLSAAGGVLGTIFVILRIRMRRLFELDQLRIRIASDLHDDIGSTLTKIAIQSEVIQTSDTPDRITNASREIGRMSRDVVSTLSDMVWSIDARHDVLQDLVDRMRSYASALLVSAEVEHSFTIGTLDLTMAIDADLRHHVYLIFKEALNNIVKHARAKHVSIDLSSLGGDLVLAIRDDGVGLATREGGHGLKNMKMRAAHLSGRLDIGDEQGTTVRLAVPFDR